MHRKALGKGLEALFSSSLTEEIPDRKAASRSVYTVPINDIIPNRNQPREQFSEEAMEELKKSITENGILEPPIVRRKGEFFELIAGERRFRAAKDLGLGAIEVILMDVESDEKMLVLSLIENIQRENLNAIEEANAYHRIMEQMNLTQEELASVVGKNRSTVANMLRLLNLPGRIQTMINSGTLAPGSARALLVVDDAALQYDLARKIANEGLSSRKAEALVKRTLSKKTSADQSERYLSPFVENIRTDIQRTLGTEVRIKGNESKGKIEVEYYSQDDLLRVFEIIKGASSDLRNTGP